MTTGLPCGVNVSATTANGTVFFQVAAESVISTNEIIAIVFGVIVLVAIVVVIIFLIRCCRQKQAAQAKRQVATVEMTPMPATPSESKQPQRGRRVPRRRRNSWMVPPRPPVRRESMQNTSVPASNYPAAVPVQTSENAADDSDEGDGLAALIEVTTNRPLTEEEKDKLRPKLLGIPVPAYSMPAELRDNTYSADEGESSSDDSVDAFAAAKLVASRRSSGAAMGETDHANQPLGSSKAAQLDASGIDSEHVTPKSSTKLPISGAGNDDVNPWDETGSSSNGDGKSLSDGNVVSPANGDGIPPSNGNGIPPSDGDGIPPSNSDGIPLSNSDGTPSPRVGEQESAGGEQPGDVTALPHSEPRPSDQATSPGHERQPSPTSPKPPKLTSNAQDSGTAGAPAQSVIPSPKSSRADPALPQSDQQKMSSGDVPTLESIPRQDAESENPQFTARPATESTLTHTPMPTRPPKRVDIQPTQSPTIDTNNPPGSSIAGTVPTKRQQPTPNGSRHTVPSSDTISPEPRSTMAGRTIPQQLSVDTYREPPEVLSSSDDDEGPPVLSDYNGAFGDQETLQRRVFKFLRKNDPGEAIRAARLAKTYIGREARLASKLWVKYGRALRFPSQNKRSTPGRGVVTKLRPSPVARRRAPL